MKRKFIWKLCLIIGISGGILLIHNSCATVSYGIRTEWYFINETKHSISYLPDIEFYRQLNVAPFDTTVFILDDTGPKNAQVQNMVPPLNPLTVVIDSVRNDTMLARKLSDISYYEYEQLGVNNFRFFFRFTYENIAPAHQNEIN